MFWCFRLHSPSGRYRMECSWLLSSVFTLVQNGSSPLERIHQYYLVILVIRYVPLRPCLSILPSVDPPLVLCLYAPMVHLFAPSIVNSWLRAILKAASVPENNSSHSFRIGAATSAALAGVPDHVIKILGWWSSNCYLWYIRTPPHVILQAARHMV